MNKKSVILMVILIIVFGININVYAEDCVGIFGKELIQEINNVFDVIRIAAPIAFLLLTSLDFAKVVFEDNKDGLDKAKKNFLRRGAAVLIIFFAPIILNLILGLVDEASIRACLNQIK